MQWLFSKYNNKRIILVVLTSMEALFKIYNDSFNLIYFGLFWFNMV